MPPAVAPAVAKPVAAKPAVKKAAPAAAAGAAATPSAQAAAESKKKAPPRSPVSMTDEELQAAVNGTLTPRATKGTAEQEALGMFTASGRRSGRPVGVTTGLPILGAWCYIFQENEKAPAKKPNMRGDKPVVSTGKFTDEQIGQWMKDEFPGRDTPAFDHPQGCRRDYNNGKFTKLVQPGVQSQRYDENAQVVGPRAGKAKKGEGTPEAPAPAAAPAAKKAPAPAAPKRPVAKAPVAAA